MTTNMTKLNVINLFGGPGVGKSTLASDLFSLMKMLSFNVELVTEYAKDMVWESRDNILSDQLYILAKQNRRLARLAEHGVKWAVTDGALLNGKIYAKDAPFALFNMISECHSQYNNYNVLLKRNLSFPYVSEGRIQKDVKEATDFDNQIENMLAIGSHPFITYRVGVDAPATLVGRIVMEHNLKTKKPGF